MIRIDELGLSPEYFAGVEEGRRHHLSSKTYSGSFLRPHKPFLSDMIARLGATSALDYGAGKGEQYRWVDPMDGKTLEQAWGFPVDKYDPCWPPFAEEPVQSYDLVICTHTLALIPQVDLRKILSRIYSLADKGVFIAEKIGKRKKGEVAQPDHRAIGWRTERWLNVVGHMAMSRPNIETVLSTTERTERGKITTRWTWVDGEFKGGVEATPKDS